MDGNNIYYISLGNLNPVEALFNAEASFYLEEDIETADPKTTDSLRRIAKRIERWHFGAGIALAVLADRIDLWRYAVNDIFAEDYARLADIRFVQVIDQLAVIASAPWCVGLVFWECTNLDDPDAITREVPFNLERLRSNPLDAKSRRGLRRVIMDLNNATTVIQVKFPRNILEQDKESSLSLSLDDPDAITRRLGLAA